MNDEIEPYLLVKLEGSNLEPAVWRFVEGQRAVTLFISEETANSYRSMLIENGRLWRVWKPTREQLRLFLNACFQQGIRWAVLDPDQEKARRIFSLEGMFADSSETNSA